MDMDYIKCGDCLELMKDIPCKSVDMILCDLPYGTTMCKWDSVLPFEALWESYNRIIKPHGAIVLFGANPFTSALVCSNIKNYKHHWIWLKNRGTGFQIARYRPMMATEDIIAFSPPSGKIKYNPQMIPLEKTKKYNYSSMTEHCAGLKKNGTYTVRAKYPTNVISVSKVSKPLHPTQKPEALLEYLIKTYSDEGDVVLDNCMGSGTSCVACVNTNRHYIGFEKEIQYFEIASERITEAKMKLI